MTPKQVQERVTEIVKAAAKNKTKTARWSYEKFFDKIGSAKRRNMELLRKFDRQFKRANVAFFQDGIDWGRVANLRDFKKGDIVYFKIRSSAQSPAKQTVRSKIENPNAGTIRISNDKSGITPFEHQKKAFDVLNEKMVNLKKKEGLLVLPTGAGKTWTAAHWISRIILDEGKKVLWIAHRHELLEQAQRTFAQTLAYRDVFRKRESFNYRLLSGIHDKPIHIQPTDDILISSKDSLNAGFHHLSQNWLKGTKEVFLVVDEAHHATAKTYRSLISKLKKAVPEFRILGLTATPFRTAVNEKGLLKKVFPDDIFYKIDLQTLVTRGILSEPHFEEVQTGQKLGAKLTDKQIYELNSKFGDFNIVLGKKNIKEIAENKERNRAIVTRYVKERRKYKQTIVFALNAVNAIALNTLFESKKVKSAYVLSDIRDKETGVTISSKENGQKIERFRKGELEVLINVNILTEGTDVPNVQTIFLTRPTVSTILMTQMMGRGLRGEKAGGTKDAYIVSFIDDWQDKISWINPEKLFIEENTDFTDCSKETQRQTLRLVAISKLEEFTMLNDESISNEKKRELEKLDFLSRIPIGIYHFRYLQEPVSNSNYPLTKDAIIEPEEKNCEVFVYDNLVEPYADFISALPSFFRRNKLSEKHFFSDDELGEYLELVKRNYFADSQKYPEYHVQDIKDILQYYAIQGEAPPFLKFEDRKNYDIDALAKRVIDNEGKATEIINKSWEDEHIAWWTFFDYDKRKFIHEIDLAKRRIQFPELYHKPAIPEDKKELRELEKLGLHEIKEVNREYGEWLSNEVYQRFRDKNGYYFSAKGGYKSKRKLDFQIDHIKPMHNGGLTTLDNLQLLTRRENARKEIK